MPVFAAFLLFVFLELFLLFMLAFRGGWGWGVFWLEVATAVAGVMVIRYQQDFTIREWMRQEGGMMFLHRAMMEGAWIAGGGLLLILPGLLTDFLGLLILVLPLLRRFLNSLRRRPPPPRDPPPSQGGGGRIIEGEVVSREDRDRT